MYRERYWYILIYNDPQAFKEGRYADALYEANYLLVWFLVLCHGLVLALYIYIYMSIERERERQREILHYIWDTCLRGLLLGFVLLLWSAWLFKDGLVLVLYIYIYIHIHICVYMYMCAYIYIYIYIYTRTHVCICICMCIYIYIYIYVYRYICIYTCYIYIYIYYNTYDILTIMCSTRPSRRFSQGEPLVEHHLSNATRLHLFAVMVDPSK